MADFLPRKKRIHLHLSSGTFNRKTRQHTFKLVLDLTEGDNTLTGLPAWVQNAFTNMAKLVNCNPYQSFEVALNDVVIEFFSTEKARTRMWAPILNARIFDFEMTRTGTEEDLTIKLSFKAVFAASKDANDFVFDEGDGDFWMSAESPQQELNLSGDNAAATVSDDEDDEEEEEEEDGEEDDEEQEASTPIAESQSAKAARIRKEAEANAANAAPAARPPMIGNVPRRATVLTH